MIRATFVMEQHLGHQTYCQNLRRFVEQEAQIQSSWAPVNYQRRGMFDLLPLPGRLRGALRGMREVHDALSNVDYDVAFFNTQVPAALGGRLTRRRPYVVATDITPIQYDKLSHLYNHRPDRSGPLAAYKHRVNIRLLREAARLLPWSSWTRESLINDYGVDPARIDVVAPGIDLGLWSPRATQQPAPLRILFVGGDLFRKGGETLLRAFRALPRGTAELHLVTRTRIEPEDGITTYYDMQPNAPRLIALYQASDVFVLPTEAEAFGIAAAEASAVGLPVIATKAGGLADVVADGETGFLIPPRDVAGLSARLQHLAANPELRKQMGSAGRQRAETLFDARRNAERITEHLIAVAK